MRSRGLLVAGLIALAASLVGAVVTGALGTTPGWWAGQTWVGDMMGRGHMGWWDGSTGNIPIPDAREVVVTATEFSFAPAELTVESGESVNLTLVNQGAVPHDLTIPELGIRIVAGPGEQSTIGFVADEPGAYQFLCTYPGHAESGMTGVLRVGADQ